MHENKYLPAFFTQWDRFMCKKYNNCKAMCDDYSGRGEVIKKI